MSNSLNPPTQFVDTDELLHAGLESAEVIDLGPEHQVGQLSVRQEDDEEHDGEAHQVLGAAGHGAGKLTHGLVQVDELKKLRGRERLETQNFVPIVEKRRD